MFEIRNNVTDDQKSLKPGDPVLCLRDDGRKTRHEVKYCAPYQASDGTWVVHLTGIAGYFALCRVTRLVIDLPFLLASAKKTRAEIANYFDDIALWNAARPEAVIVGNEADPGGEMAKAAEGLDRYIAQIEARIEEGAPDA